MSYNLNEIFKLVDANEDRVVIEVLADSPLKVAMFPFVSSEYNYITVTRGRNHVLTVIKKDGKTFSFSFGDGGYTLISDSLEELKKYVLKFIEDSGVLIEFNGQRISRVKIFYNSNYKKWQLTLEGIRKSNYGFGSVDVHYWSSTAKTFEDMVNECRRFVVASEWKPNVAVTGLDVWTAVNFEFRFK
jgi:hypothetical protein